MLLWFPKWIKSVLKGKEDLLSGGSFPWKGFYIGKLDLNVATYAGVGPAGGGYSSVRKTLNIVSCILSMNATFIIDGIAESSNDSVLVHEVTL